MLSENITAMPHSRENEEALLGAIFINPEVFVEVRDVRPGDFYIARHQFIWDAMLSLSGEGKPIDIFLLAEELERAGKLDEVGGLPYLSSLLSACPYSYNAAEYAQIVRDYSLRRKLLQIASQLASNVYSNMTGDEAHSITMRELHALLESVGGDDSLQIGEIASQLYDEAAERARHGIGRAQSRIPTPWQGVNMYLSGGFAPGKQYTVAGRPGEGKSTWLVNAAIGAALQGKRVGMFSLEMEQFEIAARVLASLSNLNANLITDGIIKTADEWEIFIQAIEKVVNVELRIAYTPRLTPEKLRARAHRMQAVYGLDMLVVDYLQLMKGDGRSANRQEEVAAISRELKILAGELHIPVVVAAQLNRAVEQRENREPQLSDLRESGAIENDADAVIFLSRPNLDDNLSKVKFAKNRSGKTGSLELVFHSAAFRFEDAGIS